ncbi:DUF6151 family protein [Prosthecomicrobium sp. N25]|uniref:DUF6151 family protein n=1 Tax=Prosthecomicrobium sp. N25 TaxID=3129254 RepID=UPI003077F9EF
MPRNETTVTFGCRCGEVRGMVVRAAPASVNRVICYCDDCQAFAHWLDRADLLDDHGGSDIVQLAPAAMSFTKGEEKIGGVRLTSRGLHRYYATCCNTPVGNMVSPTIPFVGVMAAVFRTDGQDPDAVFRPPIGAIKGEFAVGETPPGSRGISLWLMARAIAKVLKWRLSGWTWPHPFFDRASDKSRFVMTTVSPAERERLRLLSGSRR